LETKPAGHEDAVVVVAQFAAVVGCWVKLS
jgi:hypothetical protein